MKYLILLPIFFYLGCAPISTPVINLNTAYEDKSSGGPLNPAPPKVEESYVTTTMGGKIIGYTTKR